MLLAVSISSQKLASAKLWSSGRVLALISNTSESLVLALADTLLVEVPAVYLAHFNFSM